MKNMWGQIIGGALGLIGGAINGITGSGKRALKRQEDASVRLMDHQWDLNEMAAENAQARQWETYEKYQSPTALKKQYEDAGLSVGLMYGGGASGGMGQAVMGGGASGQGAPNAAAAMSAETERMALGLQLAKGLAEIQLIKAEAENKKAQTEESQARTSEINTMLTPRLENMLNTNENIKLTNEKVKSETRLTDEQARKIGEEVSLILKQTETEELKQSQILQNLEIGEIEKIKKAAESFLTSEQGKYVIKQGFFLEKQMQKNDAEIELLKSQKGKTDAEISYTYAKKFNEKLQMELYERDLDIKEWATKAGLNQDDKRIFVNFINSLIGNATQLAK